MRGFRLFFAAACVCIPVAVGTPAAVGAGPLRTAVFEPNLLSGQDGSTELGRVRSAGASFLRIPVHWSQIAPSTRPANFDPSNPDDPGYDWSALDATVDATGAAGLTPLLDVSDAPTWARAGAGISHPRAADLGAFTHAAAERYTTVRYWQLWNEPNLNTNLEPQFAGTRPVSPAVYRSLAVAFAQAVKGVSPSNIVVIGGLAPYGIQQKGKPIDNVLSVAPMTFLRDLLCISGGAAPHATCGQKVPFDIFSVHPYTWGGPTHSAFSPNDVALGNLPAVKQVLAAAWRLHRVAASAPPALWVTEFSWDTNPPDPKAIPVALQARWTAEALYHMWADGVSLVTWFLLRDEPLASSPFQSGLYYRGATVAADRPKPTLTAFRFPFVAYPRARGTYVWGRTPDSAADTVLLERRSGAEWRRVATLHANGAGIFQATLPISSRTGYLRARIGGTPSLPFGLAAVPDRRISPFGG